ncbi:hypothetical protein D9613_004635 [Agrocybe pediades]|uniref:F-box domain-containing protein n=1 Tax=Agrocybe pediades TaxID=84607 RepID=A0A8H4QZH2_9AGAR|nr:hypothetical protein D9613_004635 [Agrocybe pediades]
MSNVPVLNHDIIYTIFTLIAEDDKEHMDNRLQCILNGTLVCRHWHQSIIPASNIWCRLIYVDSARRNSKRQTLSLLQLVLKRSGETAPLFIEATASIRTAKQPLRLFLCKLMDSAWERIESITFNVLEMEQEREITTKAIRSVIARQAPNLRIFRVRGADFDIDNPSSFSSDSSSSNINDRGTIDTRPLFGNVAPRLEVFLIADIYFSLRAPWLANLRCLEVAQKYHGDWFPRTSIPKLLKALKLMPRLTSLELRNMDEFVVRSSWNNADATELPCLQYIKLCGPPDPCNFLLKHIRGARTGCLVHLTLVVERDWQAGVVYDSGPFQGLFSTSFQKTDTLRLCSAQPTTYMGVILGQQECKFIEKSRPSELVDYKGEKADSGTRIEIKFEIDQRYPGVRVEYPALLTAFRAMFSQFKDVTTLYIQDMEMAEYYIESLMSMPSVTTLEVMFARPLHWLTRTRRNDRDFPILPALQTLRVHLNSRRSLIQDGLQELSGTYRSDRISEAIVGFVRSRIQMEPAVTSIRNLEIVSTSSTHKSEGLKAIEDTAREVIDGLKVLSRSWGQLRGFRVSWIKSWKGERDVYTFPG